MTATPNWVGQVYKDTATGNVWRSNSTTPGDWTLEVQNCKMQWEPRSLDLVSMIGYFSYGNLPGITKIRFLQSQSVAGFDFEHGTALVELDFPNLTDIDPANSQSGYFYLSDMVGMTTVYAPLLQTVAYKLNVTYCTSLPQVSFPALLSVGNSAFNQTLVISNNDLLVSVSLPLFTTCNGHFWINDNLVLTTISIPSLSSVSGSFQCKNNPVLSSLNAPSLSSVGSDFLASGNTSLASIGLASLTTLSGWFDASACALSQASVDGILAKLVSIATYGNVGEHISLDGGTNSAPSSTAPGSDYAILVGRGAVVSVNP